MSVREYLNNNPAVATVGVVVLLVVALGALVMQFIGGPGNTVPILDVPYFDLGTGKVILAPANNMPPFDTGSGKQSDGSYNGVLMSIWTCDTCIPLKSMAGMTPQEIEAVEGKSMFIAYLEKYNKKSLDIAEKSKGALIEGTDKLAPPPTNLIEQGRMIKTLKGKRWVFANDTKGEMLVKKMLAPNCTGGSYPRPCRK